MKRNILIWTALFLSISAVNAQKDKTNTLKKIPKTSTELFPGPDEIDLDIEHRLDMSHLEAIDEFVFPEIDIDFDFSALENVMNDVHFDYQLMEEDLPVFHEDMQEFQLEMEDLHIEINELTFDVLQLQPLVLPEVKLKIRTKTAEK